MFIEMIQRFTFEIQVFRAAANGDGKEKIKWKNEKSPNPNSPA